MGRPRDASELGGAVYCSAFPNAKGRPEGHSPSRWRPIDDPTPRRRPPGAARRAAGMSRTPSPFTTNVAGCKATWDTLASKSQTSSAAAWSSRSIHSRSSIRGPMHDASRAAHTRAECSSWEPQKFARASCRGASPASSSQIQSASTSTLSGPERSAIGHHKFGWRRRQVEPGGRGSQRPLVGLTLRSRPAMHWASAKARPSQGLGIAARAGADGRQSRPREPRPHNRPAINVDGHRAASPASAATRLTARVDPTSIRNRVMCTTSQSRSSSGLFQ